jgi:hypothetical protein
MSIRRLLLALATLAFVALAGLSPAVAAVSSDGLWSDRLEAEIPAAGVRHIVPAAYRTLALDRGALAAALAAAPLEATVLEGRAAAARIELPRPDGSFERFAVVESPVMAPALAAKYPQIRTYRVWGLDDRHATGRIDSTPLGFHAMVRSPGGAWFIDPYSFGDTEHYQSYFTRDARNPEAAAWSCGVGSDVPGFEATRFEPPVGAPAPEAGSFELTNGTNLRTYRLVVAATGEYTGFFGGTVPDGQAAIVTAVNRVNEVYEIDLAIRMELVANNDMVVYTNAATDPYTNNNGVTMLGQNQSNLDAVIGSANYDIGHVFSTGGGGVASLGVPCLNGAKARGVTGLPSPVGDPFYIDFVAHEMGHQWGAPHSFNGSSGNCSGGNRNGPTAYEPGSGSTIMAYAGICGAQNLQSNSDPYFHVTSLNSIVNYSTLGTGNTCAVTTSTLNTPPTVDAGPTYTIPINTPFSLCGSGSDADGDAVTYGWEEFDLGPAGAPPSPVGNAPIFRSFNPVDRPYRTFPKQSDLLNNTSTIGEILPSYARTLNFRITARDNSLGGGGIQDDATQVVVSDVGGPFLVTNPNTSATTWTAGGTETVQWDPAGTNASPIDCGSVAILLSLDGGQSFPISLLETPNDGSHAVDVPNTVTSQARVQVRCAGGIFFDLSDEDFTITGSDTFLSARNFEDCRGLDGWDQVVVQ